MHGRSLINWLVPRIAPAIIRLHLGTLRIRWSGAEPSDPPVDLRSPLIYAFWHQRLLLFAHTHRYQGVTIIISQHADGELIAKTVEALGFNTVRGSSRGGGKALYQMSRRTGADLAVTPDGPRGPRHEVKAGAVYLAATTGYAVLPATVSYERYWQFGSWDGFILPHPFTRALVRAAPPLFVPPEGLEDLEPYRRRLQETMRELTADTDRRFTELWATARPQGPYFLRTRTM